MPVILLIANLAAIAVFTCLAYKATCYAVATPSRCRLMILLMAELKDCQVRLEADLTRLAGRVRQGKVRDVVAAIGGVLDRLDTASNSGLPLPYQPASTIRQVALARSAGDADLAWDELHHWLDRVSFNWSHHLHVAGQATRLGLLFTVVGVFLAFANMSDKAKPFEMFGALGLAMVTTIVGLLISLTVSHVLLQRFGSKVSDLRLESEQVVLSLLRTIGQLELEFRNASKRRRKGKGDFRGNGQAQHPVAAAVAAPSGKGGASCVDA